MFRKAAIIYNDLDCNADFSRTQKITRGLWLIHLLRIFSLQYAFLCSSSCSLWGYFPDFHSRNFTLIIDTFSPENGNVVSFGQNVVFSVTITDNDSLLIETVIRKTPQHLSMVYTYSPFMHKTILETMFKNHFH